jgi:Tol biopolymer transport system component
VRMITRFRAASLAVALLTAAAVSPAARARAQRSAVSQAYQLTHTARYDPSPSPDGKRMVYIGVVEGREQLFVMNADGTGSVQITRDDANHEDPAWSPDGTQLAFASNRNSSYQIFIMNADGSGVRLLANTEGRATAPQWGRDGARIYFPVCRNVDFGFDCEIFAARTRGFER